MANEIEVMAGALSHFLQRWNIDPSDVSLVLRTRNESTEFRLVRAIDRAVVHAIFAPPELVTSFKPGPASLQVGGIKITTEIGESSDFPR